MSRRRCAVAALRMRYPFAHTERLEVWQLLASAPARAGSASIIKRTGASSAARRMQSADRQLRNVRKQGGGIRPLPTCLRTLHPLACRRIKCGVRTPCLVRTRACGELCRGSAHSSVSSSRFGKVSRLNNGALKPPASGVLSCTFVNVALYTAFSRGNRLFRTK